MASPGDGWKTIAGGPPSVERQLADLQKKVADLQSSIASPPPLDQRLLGTPLSSWMSDKTLLPQWLSYPGGTLLKNGYVDVGTKGSLVYSANVTTGAWSTSIASITVDGRDGTVPVWVEFQYPSTYAQGTANPAHVIGLWQNAVGTGLYAAADELYVHFVGESPINAAPRHASVLRKRVPAFSGSKTFHIALFNPQSATMTLSLDGGGHLCAYWAIQET